jgi:mannosyltransferase
MKDAETIVMPRVGASEASAEDPWGEGQGTSDDRPATDEPQWRVASWLVPGLLMGALGVFGASAPGLWVDELATWGMATSSWRESWSGVRSADATSTPYHLMMRGWAELFGTSDLALRTPSILAMSAAAACVAALGARLLAPRIGLLAGVIFALLPTSTRYAQEARPYAFAVLAAVLATLFLVLAIERPRYWYLAAYGGAVLVLGLFDVVALLLLAGHGWAVLAFGRGIAGRWLLAAAVGLLPAAGLLWIGARYATYSGRIPDAGVQALAATGKELFGATALGAVLLGLALFSLPLRYSAGIFTAWAVVPSLMVLLIARVTPLSLPQCLLFTLPAWATLGAAALGRARARWSVAALAAIALIGLPVQVTFREPDGHRQATRRLAEIVEARMQPGDGVVYGSTDAGGGWVGRGALAHYLPAGRQPADVLAVSGQHTGGQRPAAECTDVAGCLGGTARLWVIRVGAQADPLHAIGDSLEQPLRTRYQVAQVWRLTGLTLALLVSERPDV